jgi:hypothetical protein
MDQHTARGGPKGGARAEAESGTRGRSSPAADEAAGGQAPEGGKLEAVEYVGQGRPAGPSGQLEEAKLRLDETGLTLEVGGGRPIRAGYRDLSFIEIQQGTALLVMGEGPDAMPWLLSRFGDKMGPMVRELRERRLRQRLTDGLVELPDEPAELVEFDWLPTGDPFGPGPDGPAAPAAGVGQLVMAPWGFVVSPIDERLPWIHYRRASIARVSNPSPGEVAVEGVPGTLRLRGLGPASTRLHDSLQKLRDGAFDDAARFVEQLLPDAPFAVRQKAGELLVDGRPARPADFGSGWPTVEAAVLGEPGFADSYHSLCHTAGDAAPRWVAMAPEDPGAETARIWFLIALPGNLVAMELVSAGAHATYFYRAVPRADYRGEAPEKLGVEAEKAVRDVSEALVDCRFLREPMALPAEQLALPKYLRYRLALAVLPSLALARSRFVARVVHSDPAAWSAAVADLVRWHGSARDEAAEWPGRKAQESQIAAAGGEDEAAESAEPEAPSSAAQPSAKSKP